MNIQQILQQIDVLYQEQKIDEVESLLLEKSAEFLLKEEYYAVLPLKNELLGIYREKGEAEKGVLLCEEIVGLFEEKSLKKDQNYGTTLLNVATAYRAFEEFSLSEKYYFQCSEVYEQEIKEDDYRFASLYNNMSLLFGVQDKFQEANDFLEKSLGILQLLPNMEVQIATAHVSLAQNHLRLGDFTKADGCIKKSIQLFSEYPDYHYSAALASAGDIEFVKKNYEKSAELYEKAMVEIEKYVGKSENYRVLEENLANAKAHFWKSGMTLSKEFYEEKVAPMLLRDFPHFLEEIAVGLVGQGSECFGFDDKYSQDHDFYPKCCLWVTESTYEKIGQKLQEAYILLENENKTRDTDKSVSEQRSGVFVIEKFYETLLSGQSEPITDLQWTVLQDYQLAQATNGEVFRDEKGEFSRIRKGLLTHYPTEVFVEKLAEKIHLVSQKGQYNLQRMLKRGDLVTAQQILYSFISDTMDVVFLLNQVYAPFYKWTYSAMKNLPILSKIPAYLQELQGISVTNVSVCETIEKIISELIEELKSQGWIATIHEGNFLDDYTTEIAQYQEDVLKNLEKKSKTVEEIVKMEWKSFDQVQGMNGRASCQDDYETFEIMRSSQFLAWDFQLLRSYSADFQKATHYGRNLITEKYAYMMESTDFNAFQNMKDKLPPVSAEKSFLIERIVEKQVNFMEKLGEKYPKFANQGRSLRSAEDSLENTSYETYLRGELSTYSYRTVSLYLEFVMNHEKNTLNTAEIYMKNVANLYGYPNLESVENSL